MIAYRTRLAALALLASAVVGPALAEEPAVPATSPAAEGEKSPSGDAQRQRTPSPIQKALDPDADGTLSAEEIAKSADALKTLDKNADGALSTEELMPERAKNADAPADAEGEAPRKREGMGEGQRPRMGGAFGLARIFDADKDRALSAEEIAKAPTALGALDADKDGKVTREEMFASFRNGDGSRQRGENRGEKPAPVHKAPDA